MKKEEKLEYLINYLLSEEDKYKYIEIPDNINEKISLYRSLVNVRLPRPVSEEFLKIENSYLKSEWQDNLTSLKQLNEIKDNIYLWRGDITKLEVDGIVNAANSQLLGCFYPNHKCIDNAIHTFAGVSLRQECEDIMKLQGYLELTGQAKITSAYNLPSNYVLHTVGPIVSGMLTERHCKELESCYRSCLSLATEKGLKSLAFCCISTGEFRFPNEEAAQIAVETVERYLKKTKNELKVVFNVFKEEDEQIYRRLLV